MLKTSLTELLGIEYPIIQGAMAWVATAELAAAVSNAGGAGIIGTGGRTPEWAREQIQKAKTLTDKPFGVNIVLQDKAHEEIKKVIMEEGVAFVTTGAGNPLPHIDDFHSKNIKILPVVPNVKLAKRVEQAGADAIIVEGFEAGGHIGTSTTLSNMIQVIPAVDIPVVIAGGIVEAKGFTVAMMMGASGVQMGTRFYASTDCVAHIKAREAIVAATDTDSATTGDGSHMVRGLKNKMTMKHDELKANKASDQEIIDLVTGTSRMAPIEGDVDWGMVQAGQVLLPIDKLLSAQEIIDSLISGYKKIKEEFCQK